MELRFQSACLRLEIFQHKFNLSAIQGVGHWLKWQQEQALGINKFPSEQKENNWEHTFNNTTANLLKFEN